MAFLLMEKCLRLERMRISGAAVAAPSEAVSFQSIQFYYLLPALDVTEIGQVLPMVQYHGYGH